MQTPMNGNNGRPRYVSPSDGILSPVSQALRRRQPGKGGKNKPLKKLIARKMKLVAPPNAGGITGVAVSKAKSKEIPTRAKKYRVLPQMSPPSLSITKALLQKKKLKIAPLGGHRTPMSKKAAAQKGKRHGSSLARGVKPRTPLGVANR